MDVFEYSKENARIREASNSVDDSDHLVSFLYELMRDHVPTGTIEKVVQASLHGKTEFCNGWLAQYAQDVAKRLRSTPPIGEPHHCEFFDDLDRTAVKDCQGDGHYECRKCERLDPESLMLTQSEGKEKGK